MHVLAMHLRYGLEGSARKLGIAKSTARNHLSSLYGKVGADNAARAAIALGWLHIPEDVDDCHAPVLLRQVPVEADEIALRIADATYKYAIESVRQERERIRAQECEESLP